MATDATAFKPEKKGFYGIWVMVAVCVIFMFGGAMTYVATMYWPSMMKLNGFQAGDLGMVAAVLMWTGLVWSPTAGWLTDKIGCRKTLLIGCGLFLLSGVLVSTVTELWQMFVYFAIPVGLGQATVMGVTVNTLIRKWYMKNAGTAVAIMYVCSSIFQIFAYPTLIRLSAQMTFRPVVLISVVSMEVVAILLVWILVKDSPESIGQNIDGMTDEEKKAFWTGLGGQIKAEKNNTPGEAIKTPQWWLWALIFGLVPGTMLGVMQNLTMMGISFGYDEASVGILMIYFMVPSMIGRLAAGWLGDRIGKRTVMIICGIVAAINFIGGYLWVSDPSSMNIFVAVMGLVIMAPIVLLSPLLGDMFGRLNMGKIMGWSGMVTTPIIGVFPLMAGMIKTATGSYNPFLLVSAVAMAAVVVMVIFMRPTETEKNNLRKAEKKS
jgi:MFS family permease